MIGWIAAFFADRGWDTTDFLIVAAFIGFAVVKFVDAKGWSPSAKTLRETNADLSARNAELEAQVDRHEKTISGQQEAIDTLKSKVAELERQSQAAVLDRLVEVEKNAKNRHEETLVVLKQIAGNTSPPIHTIEEGKGT